jgi:hypothetical protein
MWLLAKQSGAGEGDLGMLEQEMTSQRPRRVVGTRQRRAAGTCTSLAVSVTWAATLSDLILRWRARIRP